MPEESETIKADMGKMAKILTDLLEHLRDKIGLRAAEEIKTLKEISDHYTIKQQTSEIAEPTTVEKKE